MGWIPLGLTCPCSNAELDQEHVVYKLWDEAGTWHLQLFSQKEIQEIQVGFHVIHEEFYDSWITWNLSWNSWILWTLSKLLRILFQFLWKIFRFIKNLSWNFKILWNHFLKFRESFLKFKKSFLIYKEIFQEIFPEFPGIILELLDHSFKILIT